MTRTARPLRPTLPTARRLTHGLAATVLGALVLGGCGAGDDEPDASPSTDDGGTASATPSAPSATPTSPSTPSTPAEPTAPPTLEPRPAAIGEVPAAQWEAMVAAGMVRPECPVQSPDQLRRVDVDYIDFDGVRQRGHLVVASDTAGTTARIFQRLADEAFPIRQMRGVENFDGDTLASLQADNTSAFNCRRADQINAPFGDSPHANGRAVDINPLENPWMDLRCDCWSPSAEFAERTPGPGKILEGGLVWQVFTAEGWIWQNIDVPDYMHFDTGYPSRPYAS